MNLSSWRYGGRCRSSERGWPRSKVQSQKRSAVLSSAYPGAGLNRQIRRMCEHFGYEVKKLERTRIMNVSLSGIPLGEMTPLTGRDELIDLFKLIENSSSEAKPKAKAKPKTAASNVQSLRWKKRRKKAVARRPTVSVLPRGTKKKGR